ncbi:OmpA family protein [Flavobacterium alkalisoli]|uniref:OmpA family protein n=1 Tax=Flavobacterium alkalisoli TaxID=2602769 RepID=A0A5B9FWT8_9FLAO|nr:OmpA family protein [Flavobacterium alkalisoli]QEE50671.1 OmpA family protein [Flavobacterium alkalisoli]
MKKIVILIFILGAYTGLAQTGNKNADALFDNMWYVEAAKAYENAIKKGDTSRITLERAGDSYYFNTQMQEANKWYGQLVSEYPNEVSSKYLFRYAQTLEGTQNYPLAKKWMKQFAEKAYNDDRVKDFSLKDITIDDLLALEPQFTLQNLSINSKNSDFAPMYFKGQLVYATAIDSSYFHTRKYGWNNQPFLNLHLGRINPVQTDVTFLEKFSKDINTKYHEACVAFSPDEKTIYFTRNNYEGKLKKDGNGVNHLKLYSATAVEKDGKIRWENIKELPFNNDSYSVGQPAVSKDGTKLYFVSDMPGTIGETDIFVVDILGDGNYGQPKNLGETINTNGREMFPYVTDRALYFATDGHLGLGGLDVFESVITDGTFQKPVNLGGPLNTNMDDFAYIVNEETNKGFVCSNRKTGKGDDDIYSFERTPIVCKQVIKGIVSEELTGERISGATVVLYDTKGVERERTVSQIGGEYAFTTPIDCNINYFVEASKQGYRVTNKTVLTGSVTGETVVPLGISHELIIKENGLLKIKIDIIYFDLDKSYIRNDAAVELNKVVFLMNEYPNMVIKIESHTDSRGRDQYNLELSDRRAKATRDYIISQGIAAERIESAIGYGETQLINDCSNGIPCTDAQHEMNRRSEFIILKM